MKKLSTLILVVLAITFSSCARNIQVNYQLESAHTGTIVLKPSKPTEKTSVTLNDHLIVNSKKVKTITIHNVPDGTYDIHYVSGTKWYKERLDVEIPTEMGNDGKVTKLVQVPAYKNGYWYYLAGQAVLSGAIGVLLR
ncbi:hypothetical protein [Telluribacter humicola]|uniref:hypothetical protein n=1 Tax=Telluribacter humicola TaxID=1720261 RepID=UPI001A9651C0|nr:hypothetical protein [Telluribacter humicola]